MEVRTIVVVLSIFACAGCGSSSSTTNPSPTPSTTTINIVSGARTLTTTAFNPNPMTISRGTAVMWVNNDNSTHDVAANDGSWTTPTIAPGSSASVTFNTAGTFPYRCTIHPNMVGTLTVQ